MPVHFSRHFQKDLGKLSEKQIDQLYLVLKKLPNMLSDSLRHLGIGIRKLHHSGIFETRLGLGLRMIFTFKRDEITLHRLGSHDEVKKYLKNL